MQLLNCAAVPVMTLDRVGMSTLEQIQIIMYLIQRKSYQDPNCGLSSALAHHCSCNKELERDCAVL